MDYPEPKVGYWYTPFFRHQLEQITSFKRLLEVQSEIAQIAQDGICGRVYATREEAEADLTARDL